MDKVEGEDELLRGFSRIIAKKKSPTDTEYDKKVAEYWKNAYADNNNKKDNLPYEPTAVLGPKKKISIYDLIKLDFTNH